MKIIFGLMGVGVTILACIGWISNIVTLSNSEFIPTGLDILRIVGIFVAPLGAVLEFI